MTRPSLPKPCLDFDCGGNTQGSSRCANHRNPRHPAYADPAYLSARRQIIGEHVALHGWTCPGASDLDHGPHRVAEGDLTADHIISLSKGVAQGLSLTDLNHRSNLRPLCGPANYRRGPGR